MKVAVYYNNHDVRLEELPKYKPKDGEILVKTKACGVCSTDTIEWYNAPKAPVILGHEPAGIIEEVGAGVTKFKVGDRVFVHHHVACLVCEHCRRGNFTTCETFKKTHITPGGFSEYFTASALHVERDTLLIPDHVSYEAATLVEPLACVVRAIRRAEVKPTDSVVLIGTGSMGMMFIESLLFYGVRKLVVYELQDWRIAKAKELGAEKVLVPYEDSDKELKRLQGVLQSDGADKVFVTTTNVKAMKLGSELVNKGGTMMIFAPPRHEDNLGLDYNKIFFGEHKVTGSYSADHLDTRMALDLIANGGISADKIITHTFPIEKVSEAILQTASQNESLKCVITFEE